MRWRQRYMSRSKLMMVLRCDATEKEQWRNVWVAQHMHGTFRHVRSAPSRRTPHLRFDKQPGARLSQAARVETATIAIRVPGRGSTKRRTLPDAGGGTYAVRQKRVVAFLQSARHPRAIPAHLGDASHVIS